MITRSNYLRALAIQQVYNFKIEVVYPGLTVSHSWGKIAINKLEALLSNRSTRFPKPDVGGSSPPGCDQQNRSEKGGVSPGR
jgi:hypothetical protein